jgi:hypothetical protein
MYFINSTLKSLGLKKEKKLCQFFGLFFFLTCSKKVKIILFFSKNKLGNTLLFNK